MVETSNKILNLHAEEVHLEKNEINWEDYDFHPVVNLPDDYVVLDLNKSSWKIPQVNFVWESIMRFDQICTTQTCFREFVTYTWE